MRVTVAGAGRSGIAAAELLAGRGAHVTLSDVRTRVPEAEPLRALGVTLETGGHREKTFTESDLLVLSPGVPPGQAVVAAARAAGVAVIGEIELAARWLAGRVIAITGTKGKSTTTALTGRILEASGFRVTVGGNIGVPLSTQVAMSTPDTLHLVEASSFQLEHIDSFHPWVAVMLNLSPDHLDRHATFAAYASAKTRIFENQSSEDWAVINADDPAVLEAARRGRAARWLFGRRASPDEGTALESGWIVDRHRGGVRRLVPVTAIHLPGAHLLDDVMAAVAVGTIVGAQPEAMTEAVEGFRGLEHVMELVGELDGVRFVNDSKATNVEAARRAIETFDGGVVLIVGGRFKGGDLRLLRTPLAERVRSVISIGESQGAVRQTLGGIVPIHDVPSLEEAVTKAYQLARPEGVVLLAPACSSFDMFRDYADRGRRFKQEVERLGAADGGAVLKRE